MPAGRPAVEQTARAWHSTGHSQRAIAHWLSRPGRGAGVAPGPFPRPTQPPGARYRYGQLAAIDHGERKIGRWLVMQRALTTRPRWAKDHLQRDGLPDEVRSRSTLIRSTNAVRIGKLKSSLLAGAPHPRPDGSYGIPQPGRPFRSGVTDDGLPVKDAIVEARARLQANGSHQSGHSVGHRWVPAQFGKAAEHSMRRLAPVSPPPHLDTVQPRSGRRHGY